jgi:uncharacterized membrane protein YkoI
MFDRRSLLTAVLCLALAAAPAMAQPADPRRSVQQGQALPLGVVLERVSPNFPGQLLRADLTREGGDRLVYKLRILDDSGRITNVTADARTGQVLGARSGGR